MSTDWVAQVSAFWFDELSPEAWFEKNEAVDRQIRERFLSIYENLAQRARPDELLAVADMALAAIIVLDQFPRNMFRGTPRSFEGDPKALSIAERAVASGLDQLAEPQRRVFIYLPFEHSEKLEDQDKSVELFDRLGDPDYLRYAHAHRDIIVRFGRFPHRNGILGRPSTREELAFLQTPGSGF